MVSGRDKLVEGGGGLIMCAIRWARIQSGIMRHTHTL